MLPSDHSKNFFKKLDLDFKFVEFDFWPIQFENLTKNFNKQLNLKIKKHSEKKIIICPIQKFDQSIIDEPSIPRIKFLYWTNVFLFLN